MSRSASRLDDDTSPLGELARAALAAAGGAIVRNPGAVAGGTAFLVALSFISANALWNQERPHTTTFFVTREAPVELAAVPDDAPRVAPDADQGQTAGIVPPPERRGDPTVEQVQSALVDLNLYTGTVDGIAGPQTRKAVEDYQKLAGLDVSGEITDALLRDLEGRRAEATAVPVPAPRPAFVETAARTPGGLSRDEIVRIQAGLKAFGHDGIEIDGVVGFKTKAAVREFQSLFGLPVNGEPDRALMDKMREIGLTN